MKTPQDVILKPVVSERAYDFMGEGTYQFKVAKDSNKHQIKEAVETLFKVTVTKVNTINMPSKPKKRGGRFHGSVPGWKKAIVKLAEGNSIPFFEGMT